MPLISKPNFDAFESRTPQNKSDPLAHQLGHSKTDIDQQSDNDKISDTSNQLLNTF